MTIAVVYNKSFYGMDEIPSDSVDLILTDPPYGISHDGYESNEDIGYKSSKGSWYNLSKCEQSELSYNLVRDSFRVLKPGGSLVVSGVFGSLVPIWDYLVTMFEFRHHIIWHKVNPAPCIHRRSLVYSNEILLWFSKGRPWKFNYEFTKCVTGKQLHDVWEFPSTRKMFGVTRKPEALMTRIIRMLTDPGDIVVDPCCGSCSSGDASRLLGSITDQLVDRGYEVIY